MKLFVVFCVVMNFCGAFGLDKDDERELVNHVLVECKAKEGGSDEDFNKMLNEQVPETKTAKCMAACAYEKVGVVSSVTATIFFFTNFPLPSSTKESSTRKCSCTSPT
jgi:PBP/GOBP family